MTGVRNHELAALVRGLETKVVNMSNVQMHAPQYSIKHPPKKIGPYRIISIIGDGPTGTVYRAEQDHPRRTVAVKIFRPNPSLTEAGTQLLQREAEVLTRLRHPAIAPVYDFGCMPAGHHYYAMECVQGQSLRDFTSLHPVTCETRAGGVRALLRMFQSICEGVHYAHGQGVVHRHLRPSNILVQAASAQAGLEECARTATIKLVDFGMTPLDVDRNVLLQQEGGGLGLLPYIAPERIGQDPKPADVRSDVYSLGVILYGMLTGSLPHESCGFTLVAISRILHEAPKSPKAAWWEMGRRMDSDLEMIVLKSLAKDPDERYATAWALGKDLQRYLDKRPIRARPRSVLYEMRKALYRHRTSVGASVWALLVLLKWMLG